MVLAEYLACNEVLLARRDRLDTSIAEQAKLEQCSGVIARLRCMRGIDTLTAAGLVAEIGDFAAFEHPRNLSSFVGLVPSERSSGEKRRQGSITKAGSSHARLLVEAAWHNRRRPTVSVVLKRRKAGQSPAAIEAARRAQLRLSTRWAHLDSRRGKRQRALHQHDLASTRQMKAGMPCPEGSCPVSLIRAAGQRLPGPAPRRPDQAPEAVSGPSRGSRRGNAPGGMWGVPVDPSEMESRSGASSGTSQRDAQTPARARRRFGSAGRSARGAAVARRL